MPGTIPNEEVWRGMVSGTGSVLAMVRRRNKRLPGSPRCKQCLLPLGGPLAWALRMRGLRPSDGNPNFCNNCELFVRDHPGGVEVELTFLFADVRGSTSMAERVTPTQFTETMNQFFGAASRVLIESDAYIDKLVGDEVVSFYMPYLGTGNSRRAVLAARQLLIATGHQDLGGPWLPVGVGVNTGVAFIGSVGTTDGRFDFTAMGDVVNSTARLSSLAATGEVLIGEAAWASAELDESVEARTLHVKGRSEPISVYVLTVGRDSGQHPD
jgi:adenylate cyclase